MRALLAAGLIALTGCSSMQPISVAYISEARPAVVHVSDGFGVVTTIANPRVSGDSVVGTALGADRPVVVPLREAQRITAVRRSSARTAMLIGGLTALGALVTYAALSAANGDDSGFCDYDRQPMGGGASECGYPSNP
jgi:hypothetical protein